MNGRQPRQYKSCVKPIWCPGCGDYGVLEATTRVFAKLGLPSHKIAVVSGIGCSSRISGYFETYGINGIHGRGLAIAQGLKLATQIRGEDIKVLSDGGDGDIFSIGAGHLPHGVRRNVDITCVMMDNQVYAMTKGQASPTTPCEEDDNPPVDPLLDMLTYGVGFLAQGLALNVLHLSEILEAAILYKGFAFVNVQSQCVSFRKKEWNKHLKEDGFYLKAGERVELPNGESWIHDPTNKELARKLVEVSLEVRPYYGIIYRGPEKETYVEKMRKKFNC